MRSGEAIERMFDIKWSCPSRELDVGHFCLSFDHSALNYWGPRPIAKRWEFPLSLLPHFFQKKPPCWNTAGGQRSEALCANPLYSSMHWEIQGRSINFFSSGQARTPPLKITYSGVESAIKGETNAQVKPHETKPSVLQGWQKDNCVKQARCLLSSGQPSSWRHSTSVKVSYFVGWKIARWLSR